MKMSIDKILEKAFTTSDLANGGLLEPDQSAKFVRGIFEKAVVTKECRRVPMNANKKVIDKITYGSKILKKPTDVGTEFTDTVKPTTSKVELSAEEVIVGIDLGYDSLEDNIEKKGLLNTVLELTSQKIGPELDDLVLYGDKAGATGTVRDQIDGLFKQITTYTYDAAQSVLTDTILKGIYRELPGKYADSEKDLRFYVSHLARLDYVSTLAGKGVNEAFVRYLIEAQEPAYSGIGVRKVGAIETENIGGGSPVVNGSKALLIDPRNIVLGVHRDIMMEMERKPRKRTIEITVTMKLDVKLEEEEAAVKATNIKHS